MNATHASIRADLYEKGLRIIAGKKYNEEIILQQFDPLYWEIVGNSGNSYTLRQPFGDDWLFDSIDLDFYTITKN